MKNNKKEIKFLIIFLLLIFIINIMLLAFIKQHAISLYDGGSRIYNFGSFKLIEYRNIGFSDVIYSVGPISMVFDNPFRSCTLNVLPDISHLSKEQQANLFEDGTCSVIYKRSAEAEDSNKTILCTFLNDVNSKKDSSIRIVDENEMTIEDIHYISDKNIFINCTFVNNIGHQHVYSSLKQIDSDKRNISID